MNFINFIYCYHYLELVTGIFRKVSSSSISEFWFIEVASSKLVP